MRFLAVITICCFYFSIHGQSFLLKEGQKSSTLPLSLATNNGSNQIAAGYVFSKNGKMDLGIGVDYVTDAVVFIFSPFYRAYFYNDPEPNGVVLSTALSYVMFLDQNGGTAHLASLNPRLQYRITTEKVVLTPEFNIAYTRALEVNADDVGYAAAMNFSFITPKGFITFAPRYNFNNGGLFSVGLNFQWVKE